MSPFPCDLCAGIIQEKMSGVLGNIDTELDGRFIAVRREETNLGEPIT